MKRRVTASMWREKVEQMTFRGKMRQRFIYKKSWARSFLADVEKEWQNGRDGEWQKDTPCEEELELVSHSSDLRFDGKLMHPAYHAEKSGDWRNSLEVFLTGSAFGQVWR